MTFSKMEEAGGLVADRKLGTELLSDERVDYPTDEVRAAQDRTLVELGERAKQRGVGEVGLGGTRKLPDVSVRWCSQTSFNGVLRQILVS